MEYELMTLKELETFLNICERHLRSIRKRATFPKADLYRQVQGPIFKTGYRRLAGERWFWR